MQMSRIITIYRALYCILYRTENIFFYLLCVGVIDCGDIVSTDLYMGVHTLTPGHILGTH
jgi:hypothetical protein